MINKLNTAVFLLVQIIIITVLSVVLTASVKAAGTDEEPTPTPAETVTPTPEAVYGGSPSYGSPVYGGGVIETKEGEVFVDKLVKNPATGEFVDHLGPMDPKYRPLNIVTFKITVKNPGEDTVEKAQIVDTLPEFIDYMSGPGNYDSDKRQLIYDVENLGAGESRDFEIKGRISHQSTLPEEKSIVCPINVVEATLGDIKDSDESQFCIEKEMVVPQVPEAGSETLLLSLLGSLLTTGLYLRKKSVI